jgi:hypothetical protein
MIHHPTLSLEHLFTSDSGISIHRLWRNIFHFRVEVDRKNPRVGGEVGFGIRMGVLYGLDEGVQVKVWNVIVVLDGEHF